MEAWFAVYGGSQKEQFTVRLLRMLDFEAFWPYVSDWVNVGHKSKTKLIRRSWLPSGYLFVEATEDRLWIINKLLKEFGLGVLLHAPNGEPEPIPAEMMKPILDRCDDRGEVYMEEGPKKRQKFKVGDEIKCMNERHPLFNLSVEVKKSLDSGVVKAIYKGNLAGTDEVTIEDPSRWELAKGAA